MPSPVSEADFSPDEPMEQQQQTSAPATPKSTAAPNPYADNTDAAGSTPKALGIAGSGAEASSPARPTTQGATAKASAYAGVTAKSAWKGTLGGRPESPRQRWGRS